MRYSVQPRDQISVKGYWFLSFAKHMGKDIGKNISKNLSGKYFLVMLKNLLQMNLKYFRKSNSKNSRNNLFFDW